jgi:hypothetical protein
MEFLSGPVVSDLDWFAQKIYWLKFGSSSSSMP